MLSFANLHKHKNPEKIQEEGYVPNITIWVHGTNLWPFKIFKKYWVSSPTLMKVASMRKGYYLRNIVESLCKADPGVSMEDFYLLRWSGNLSVSEREETGFQFYKEMEKLLEKYKEKYNATPSINIISHSHGGNVALNLAKVTKDPKFRIEKLILLACPVQKHTRQLISDPIFENIYSFYSTMDLIQVMDLQGFHSNKNVENNQRSGFFSGRYFSTDSKKISNIKVKMNGRGVFHVQFLSSEFISLLPTLIEYVEEWKKEEDRNDFLISIVDQKPKNIKSKPRKQ